MTDARETREHYKVFSKQINKIGRDEFDQRWEQIQRTIYENDFAYSGYNTPEDKPRPWELDAIPFLISSSEWSSVETALKQRAHVLNLILQDLYGNQELLKQNVIPPELVFSHPGFLRAYHGLLSPQDTCLHFYAADIARSANGEWWVLSDRTEAPSGLGYALENRILISRMLPEVYRKCQIQRLAPFFMAVQNTLRNLSPNNKENPHIVLLSHGQASTSYFENAYLARYLGYTLVEGEDLAVRNNQVLLKTLGGLIPVDVVFRRQNSADCDPLELLSDSRLGIAGLTQAVRSRTVGVANSLGAGLVESAAFMSFMPRMCQFFLGEELLMPSVASWWCGQPKELNYVLEHLEDLIIQPAFRNRGKDGVTREKLASLSLSELTETIRKNPTRYVAQEKMMRSSLPTWNVDQQSAHLALRVYSVAADNSYVVMPGGLARTSTSVDPLELSIRKGEGSKDTWVLADTPVDQTSLLGEHNQSITLLRTGSELPSRAADNIFWLGRQLERAESFGRLLRSTVSRLCGETRTTSDLEIPTLLRCLADQGQIEPGYAIDNLRVQLPQIEGELAHIVFDQSQPVSLRSVLDELVRLGAKVRNRISVDTWRIIRRVDKGFRPARYKITTLSDILTMTDELITELAAFSGIVMESMTRTQVFRFLELGRRIERSIQTISLVKNSFMPMPEVQGPILETVLEVADSLMTYRSRYMSNLQLAAVLDLLLTDDTNPRSLVFQFTQISKHVDRLPRDSYQPGYSLEQSLAMSLLQSVQLFDIQQAAEHHSLGNYDDLEQHIDSWNDQIPKLSEAISHRYLVHATPAHQLTDISPQ